MKKKFDILFSFFLYGFGLLCFLVSDIFVSENFSQKNIADWAFYKSTIMILGSLVLLGYDQVFVRDPSLISRIFKRFFLQAILITILVVTIIALLKNYSVQKTLLLFSGVLLLGLINYSSSSLRACFNLWQSQFSTNFWKILLSGFLFFEFFEELSLYFIIPILITLVLAIIIGGHKTKENSSLFENLSDIESNTIAKTFLFTNMTLLFAVYGEQFLINLSGDIKASSHLFKYYAVFTPIALSVNGFLAFYFGPKIRRNKQFTINQFKKFSVNISVYAICISIISLIFGYLYMTYFSSTESDLLDWTIIISLTILSIIRGVYVATSVCLGVFSDKDNLKSVAILFWCSSGIYILAVFITLYLASGILAAQIISILSLLNWLCRLIISNFYTHKILSNAQVMQ